MGFRREATKFFFGKPDMPYRVFQYRIPVDGDQEDLNAFLGSNRVTTIHREIVSTPNGPMLIFIVEYRQQAAVRESNASGPRDNRVDYRKILSPAEFDVYMKLRDVRKLLSEEEAQPVFGIASIAQMAEMVQKKCSTVLQLREISGIGEVRAEKYGPRFLPILQAAFTGGSPGSVGGSP